VLDLPYHLSYPFLFEDQGEVFMIPETAQDHTVRLFRALDFPGSWKPEKVLFQGHAADTTLWRQDGFYWFFTSVADRPEAGQSLLLFSAKSLTGEWTYHPANPISLDVRNARSAGALFTAGGRLIRPCQDGSAGYGCAINFQEILKLDPSDYLEQPLGTARSSWARGLVGTHTYNRTDTVEVLDGCILVPRARVAERRDPPHAGWRPSTSW